MGIEPTWDFIRPHAGVEVQEIHQESCRSRLHALFFRALWFIAGFFTFARKTDNA